MDDIKKIMNLIFLDIDGVLKLVDGKPGKNRFNDFDKDSVKWLNRITDETSAKIVISSVWSTININYWRNTFRENAIKANVVGKTCHTMLPVCDEKGWGINHWLRKTKWKVTGFVIIDDDINGIKNYFSFYNIAEVDPKVGIDSSIYRKVKTNLEAQKMD